MLSVVRGRSGGHGLPDLMSVLGDATSIPVKRSSVRHVLLAFLYHEVGDRNALLRACRDVLEPRGRLTIVDFQKMETGFGPPVAERVAPDEVLRDAASLFILVSRHDAEAYYQLALERM